MLTVHRLLGIKAKLRQQREHMDELDKHMSVIPMTLGYKYSQTNRDIATKSSRRPRLPAKASRSKYVSDVTKAHFAETTHAF